MTTEADRAEAAIVELMRIINDATDEPAAPPRQNNPTSNGTIKEREGLCLKTILSRDNSPAEFNKWLAASKAYLNSAVKVNKIWEQGFPLVVKFVNLT